MLADDLQRIKQREQVAKWDEGERRIAAELPLKLPQSPFTPDVAERWDRFLKWAALKSVRSLPARPAVVAAFILDQTQLGMAVANLLAILEVVERAHDLVGLPNPVRCALPRLALERIIKTDPPRSWPKEEKAQFALLPPDIRHVIAEREKERDAGLRRKQNELAEKRKELSASTERKERENGKAEIA